MEKFYSLAVAAAVRVEQRLRRTGLAVDGDEIKSRAVDYLIRRCADIDDDLWVRRRLRRTFESFVGSEELNYKKRLRRSQRNGGQWDDDGSGFPAREHEFDADPVELTGCPHADAVRELLGHYAPGRSSDWAERRAFPDPRRRRRWREVERPAVVAHLRSLYPEAAAYLERANGGCG